MNTVEIEMTITTETRLIERRRIELQECLNAAIEDYMVRFVYPSHNADTPTNADQFGVGHIELRSKDTITEICI